MTNRNSSWLFPFVWCWIALASPVWLRAQDVVEQAQPAVQSRELSDGEKKLAIDNAKAFLTFCNETNVDGIFKLFSDELKVEVDKSVLLTYANSLNDVMGKMDVFGEPQFVSDADGGTAYSLVTDVLFENGVTNPSFTFDNGKMVGFNLGWPADAERLVSWRGRC
ncbi:MAG: hypothetical protein R3C03_08105 [Pirellulaceae bacterium]